LRTKRLAWAGLAVLAAAALAVTAWYQWVYLVPRFSPADPIALDALRSDREVEVSAGRWIVMRPSGGIRDTGLVFYPGGQVAAEGYAEPLHRIAAAGYLVVLVPMPFDLAVLAPNRAAAVIEEFPQVRRWVVAGHSLGGAMAARFVYSHPDHAAGLLLWDGYPADSDDLSAAALPVRQLVRVRADGHIPEAYEKTRHLLPAATQVVTLPGGTHMNYGRFIAAERLRRAEPTVLVGSMPIDEQHARIVAATVEFLVQVDAAGNADPRGNP
jgi:hypothetical protein